MNKTILLLSIVMGAIVLASNYLVQFPVQYYGLSDILTYGAFTYPIAFLITDLHFFSLRIFQIQFQLESQLVLVQHLLFLKD